MIKKPSIPLAPKADRTRTSFDAAIKERLEILCGERSTRITRLDPAIATAEDNAKKINEILELLQ